jgi:hypothetical protein
LCDYGIDIRSVKLFQMLSAHLFFQVAVQEDDLAVFPPCVDFVAHPLKQHRAGGLGQVVPIQRACNGRAQFIHAARYLRAGREIPGKPTGGDQLLESSNSRRSTKPSNHRDILVAFS